mgnify:CR=1 FL=1
MSSSGRTSAADRPDVDRIVRRVRDISALPHAALKVMQVANDPKSGASEMKQAMAGSGNKPGGGPPRLRLEDVPRP